MKRNRVLLLCGGQSEEHEVSLSSARSVLAAVGDQFAVSPLVIDKSGSLLSFEASCRALNSGGVRSDDVMSGALQNIATEDFDVVFPLLHGPFGEDGSIQGLLKLMSLPFVGSDVLASAVGMDKLMMKAVFSSQQMPQVPYCGVTRQAWQNQPEQVLKMLTDLSFPLFVKPANLGSSVGISKAIDRSGLSKALDEAAKYDRRIIVEQGVENARELEVGVLGNDNPQASPVGEICFNNDFYDYDTKYTEGQAELKIPAELPPEIAAQCRDLALRAFAAIDAAGLARVDFFYSETKNRLFLNEINTVPGFTTTSMYPKLWEAAGISYGELIEKLLELAKEKR